ncbi:spermatogenesis-associated serine-rich protein 2 [Elysia marginata]|uniref:Spermatogenesis-associated serine-rich protein 2 n=1 Tax=Elysia marginata TaxID=1093978 RepID=A0AAV4GK11_9GAST|nr:spermatogenesis-associated serine-rich protein 2 [Elysia marginata]
MCNDNKNKLPGNHSPPTKVIRTILSYAISSSSFLVCSAVAISTSVSLLNIFVGLPVAVRPCPLSVCSALTTKLTSMSFLFSEATSSAIHFDASTKTVMAEATHENIKEKVLAVREVVPGKSNNEVILVLQYYDYSVERTIQAYLEDGAKEALREWNFTGSKPNKKRKNKKKTGSGAGGGTNGDKTDTVPSTSSPATGDATKLESSVMNGEAGLPNGDLQHDADRTTAASTSQTVPQPSSEQATAATAPLPQRQHHSKARGNNDKNHQHHNNNQSHLNSRERTVSEVSTSSGVGDATASKRPFHGLEKAIKDLHRQTTSLERLRNLLDHEIDRSYRSVKSVFEELRQGLNNREAQLYEEMDKLKKEASDMLEMRQGKAADLRRQVDRAERMTETEVSELRAEVKHFVSERRHDEELGRATRFVYDSDHLLDEINKFGEVVHVKSVYTARRASTSSIASSVVSHDGTAELDSPNSQEMNELQDRLKNSLKLQTTTSAGTLTSQNGSSETDFIPSKSGRRRPGNSQRGSANRSRGSGSSDVNSDQVPSYPRAASSGIEKHNNSNGPSGNSSKSYTSNTGSPSRGGSRPAIGGRGRGGRGGAGRGGGPRGQRPLSGQGALKSTGPTPSQSGPISVST